MVVLGNRGVWRWTIKTRFSRHQQKREPWNKGKFTGAKPPLRQKHVWAIRTKLQIAQQIRDLALFNLAIDSKLRGCDVVAIKVDDVAPTATPWIGRRFARERPGVRSALN